MSDEETLARVLRAASDEFNSWPAWKQEQVRRQLDKDGEVTAPTEPDALICKTCGHKRTMHDIGWDAAGCMVGPCGCRSFEQDDPLSRHAREAAEEIERHRPHCPELWDTGACNCDYEKRVTARQEIIERHMRPAWEAMQTSIDNWTEVAYERFERMAKAEAALDRVRAHMREKYWRYSIEMVREMEEAIHGK